MLNYEGELGKHRDVSIIMHAFSLKHQCGTDFLWLSQMKVKTGQQPYD